MDQPAHWARHPRAPKRLSGVLLIALLAGCNQGKLVLNLELPPPTVDNLNPMVDERLHRFTLQVRATDGTDSFSTVTFDPTQQSLNIGEVPVGPAAKLTLVGYSASNQVLAYGETGPLNIESGATTQASMVLRKPLAYVGGNYGPSYARIKVFDTSRTDTADAVADIELAGFNSVTAVATTPDGRFLLAAVESGSNQSQLVICNTANHNTLPPVPLEYQPTFMSVSPDGQWILLSDLKANKVAVLDLPHILAGGDPSLSTREIEVAEPSLAAFVQWPAGEDLAVVLSNRMQVIDSCDLGAPMATLAVIRLSTGAVIHYHDLQTSARDVVTRPGDPHVYVAATCQDQVSVFHAYTYAESLLINLQRPSSLIVKGNTLWAGAVDDLTTSTIGIAKILVSVVNLNDPRQPLYVWIPFPPETRAVPTVGDSERSKVFLSIEPNYVNIYRLSVPPGEDRLSALVYAKYLSDEVTIQIDTDSVVLPPRSIESFSYVGLDTATEEIRRRYRATCDASDIPSVPATRGCDDLESHEMSENPFLPLGATSLYGVP